MNRNYFVCVQYKYPDSHQTFFMSTTVEASSDEEALGRALVKQGRLNGGMDGYTLVGYDIMGTNMVDPENSMTGYKWECAITSFRNWVKICGSIIMQGVDQYLDENKKINAIKYLREYCSPYIGLKGCKEIVEQRMVELRQDANFRSSLSKLIEPCMRELEK